MSPQTRRSGSALLHGRIRAAAGLALLACLPALLAGCSGDDAAEGKPGTLRIAKAVIARLLSDSSDAGSSERTSRAAAEPEATVPLPVAEPEPPQTCVVPYSGPVTIIAASTPNVLRRSVAERRGVPLVYETDDTAIWQDGRVMTVDVENVGSHLNAVGWAANPIQLLGASARPGGSTANLGWDSGESQFASKTTKSRKTRRRG
jgi:hypothetical protein